MSQFNTVLVSRMKIHLRTLCKMYKAKPKNMLEKSRRCSFSKSAKKQTPLKWRITKVLSSLNKLEAQVYFDKRGNEIPFSPFSLFHWGPVSRNLLGNHKTQRAATSVIPHFSMSCQEQIFANRFFCTQKKNIFIFSYCSPSHSSPSLYFIFSN